jgi:hypothetical protein
MPPFCIHFLPFGILTYICRLLPLISHAVALVNNLLVLC